MDRLFTKILHCSPIIGIEHGGLRGSSPPPEILQGGSTPAEILLNLIAVTILANPETLNVEKDSIHA